MNVIYDTTTLCRGEYSVLNEPVSFDVATRAPYAWPGLSDLLTKFKLSLLVQRAKRPHTIVTEQYTDCAHVSASVQTHTHTHTLFYPNSYLRFIYARIRGARGSVVFYFVCGL
jgi:hypothetical protein